MCQARAPKLTWERIWEPGFEHVYLYISTAEVDPRQIEWKKALVLMPKICNRSVA